MLTKRQQEALIEAQWVSEHWLSAEPLNRSEEVPGTWFGCIRHFGSMTVYSLMDAGLVAFKNAEQHIRLTPDGAKLAAILAKLPTPLTKRQWGCAVAVS